MSDHLRKISVIVPVFNTERYIQTSIESVLRQAQVGEVIVVDDHSTDASVEIVRELMKKDPRISLLKLPQDAHGVSSARNFGSNAAAGEWLWFVDADDMIPEGAIESFFRGPDAEKADIIIGNYACMVKQGGLVQYAFDFPVDGTGSQNVLEPLARRIAGLDFPFYPGSIWCCLFRSSFIRRYKIQAPDGMKIGEDGVFFARALMRSPYVAHAQGCIYHYRTKEAKEGIPSTMSRYNTRMMEDTSILLETRSELSNVLGLVKTGETYIPRVPVHLIWNLYQADFPYSSSVRIKMLRDISREHHAAFRKWRKKFPGCEFDRACQITFCARYLPRLTDLIVRMARARRA